MLMTDYKALSIGKNQRILVPKKDVITKLAELYEKDSEKDYYVSIFDYNQSHFDQFKKTNSLSGIENLTTNTILFDFDSKTNLDKAKEDVLTLVGRLVQKGINKDNIDIAFSGSKGFHLQLSTDKKMDKNEVDNIRNELTKDLTTSDKSIKDNQRIIRATLSKHNDTKLYKIPLTVDELASNSIANIRTMAITPDDSRFNLANNNLSKIIELPEDIYNMRITKKKEPKITEEYQDKPDFNKNKTGLTNAKYALSEGYFEQGERNEAVMILAATYHALGYHKEISYNNLKATIRLRAQRLGLSDLDEAGKKELWSSIETVYDANWKGGMYSEETNELLIKTKQRYNIQSRYEGNLMVKLPQVNSIFSDFATNIDKNTLKLGIPSFDQEIRVTTSTLVSILAAPSAGKSSISFGILNSTSRAGIKSMFFSLDMAAPQVYQRLAQRHTGYHSDRLFAAYQNNDSAVIEKVEKTLADEYENVQFCFRGAMDVEIIREALLKEKETSGEFPKVVVVDYLENVLTDLSNDPTISKGFVARALKDIANEFAICVILLTQPAKVSGGPSEELNSYYAIKGSGLVAEASATVITMHRPGFDPKNPADDNFITLTVVKNRMGSLGTFDYHWEGVRGTIRELTTEEQQTLKVVREQNFAKKKGMSDI